MGPQRINQIGNELAQLTVRKAKLEELIRKQTAALPPTPHNLALNRTCPSLTDLPDLPAEEMMLTKLEGEPESAEPRCMPPICIDQAVREYREDSKEAAAEFYGFNKDSEEWSCGF